MPTRLFSINLGPSSGSGPGVLVARSGIQAISNGSATVSVVFSSDIGTTNYSISTFILNTTDPDPIKLEGTISARVSTGFTITFNAPADTANYSLLYQASVYV